MKRLIAAAVWVAGIHFAAGHAAIAQIPAIELRHGLEVDVSAIDGDQVEPFIAVAPRDPNRVVAVAMDFKNLAPDAAHRGVYVSSNRGQTWSVVQSGIRGDPVIAADTEGSFWIGGLSSNELGFREVRMARIAPGRTAIAAETVLPQSPDAVTSDKPMISIDNSAASSTYGRLYATWVVIGLSGYGGVVLSYCDTRAGDSYSPARCDDPRNWATPFPMPGGAGIKWGSDVATGPNGEVYAVWRSTFTATIEGATCTADCISTAQFSPSVIAQPKGPIGGCQVPSATVNGAPTLDVDISSGPQRGRVYVTWGDHRLDSGQTPCTIQGGHQPTDMSLDAYVASELAGLPGGALPSELAGQLVYTDGDTDSEGRQGVPNSDEFFATIAVDDSNGATWLSFYSTRLDPEREATNLYLRRLSFDQGALTLSAPWRLSRGLDVTGTQETFDYGHYNGLDVSGGWPFATWVGKSADWMKSTVDKDVFTYVPAPRHGSTQPAAPAGDCTPRRRVRLRIPASARLRTRARRFDIYVGRRRTARASSRRRRVTIRLGSTPTNQVRIRIVAVTNTGRRTVLRRTVSTCVRLKAGSRRRR